MRKVEFVRQFAICFGGLKGRKVSPLNIFDQGEFQGPCSVAVRMITGTLSRPASFAALRRRSPAIKT
jgi:hypothetical protein